MRIRPAARSGARVRGSNAQLPSGLPARCISLRSVSRIFPKASYAAVLFCRAVALSTPMSPCPSPASGDRFSRPTVCCPKRSTRRKAVSAVDDSRILLAGPSRLFRTATRVSARHIVPRRAVDGCVRCDAVPSFDGRRLARCRGSAAVLTDGRGIALTADKRAPVPGESRVPTRCAHRETVRWDPGNQS